MALYSTQVEKHFLSGVISNPDIISDVDAFISEKDFYNQTHSIIYSCIRSTFLKGDKIDIVMLGQQIKSLGIAFKDDINIFDYLEAIAFTPANHEATLKAAKELVKLRALRDIENTCQKIQAEVNKSSSLPLDEVISSVDAIYGEKMSSFEIESEPEDIFSDMYEMVEEIGNNPVSEIGLTTPYTEFNRFYGGLRGGNVYAIASRAGQGKTTLLNHMGCETGRINNVPVLILDTEMTSKEIKLRNAAAFSNVPLNYLEKGNWRKNPEMVEKVRKNLKNIKNSYRVFHYYVGTKNTDQVISIIRRWFYKVVGRGNKGLVIYDYLKLTGEKLSQNWAEHQALGEKVTKLKALTVELDIPLLTAIQINRTGENSGRDSKNVVDDSSAIATSDRLAWFATYLAIFRRKTADEIALDTIESGTHKLIEIKARYQGEDAAGHQDLIQRTFPDGTRKYVRNYINFDVQNFAVIERGSLRDSISRQNAQFAVEDQRNPVEVSEATL